MRQGKTAMAALRPFPKPSSSYCWRTPFAGYSRVLKPMGQHNAHGYYQGIFSLGEKMPEGAPVQGFYTPKLYTMNLYK